MGFSKFSHVKISAIAGVVPEKVINIDDEIDISDILTDIMSIGEVDKVELIEH